MSTHVVKNYILKLYFLIKLSCLDLKSDIMLFHIFI
jgi:hypothetical protein